MFRHVPILFLTTIIILFHLLQAVEGWLTITSITNNYRRHEEKIRHQRQDQYEEEQQQHNQRQQRILVDAEGRRQSIVSRTIPINSEISITVWELEKTANIVEMYWEVEEEESKLDPFGLVTWPGAVIAGQELLCNKDRLKHVQKVFILGAGVGIETQIASFHIHDNNINVTATDIHPMTIQLLEYGIEQQQADIDCSSSIVSTAIFNITDHDNYILPTNCDLLIIADVLYNDILAESIIKRCIETRRQKCQQSPPIILITDSQRFVKNFDTKLNQMLNKVVHDKESSIQWSTRYLHNFHGSGVAIDEDQIYNVDARIIWIGL